jgi:arylsulfatase A-like enzyme
MVVWGVFLTAPALASADEHERKPNVILFLVDDMGWIAGGAYGSKYYATPHIDRFASRSMRFTDAYAQPLCSPTRASLMTGKYSARHGITSATGHLPPQPSGYQFLPVKAAPNRPIITPESKNHLPTSELTVAEALSAAGWSTAHIGKWHLGLTAPHWPERHGFEVAFHCHPDPGPPGNYFSPYGVLPVGEPRGQNRVGTITDGPPGEYIVDRVTDEAIRFIEAHRDRPFYLNLWQYGVHGPWGHKLEYTRQFAGKADPRGKQGNPIMASMLRSVDESFGRILETLDRLRIADNTIVVFNSDNGGNVHSNVPETAKTAKAERNKSAQLADWRKWAGDLPPTNNDPLRSGKGTLYEGGVRVPLMWSWTGRIPAGSTSLEVVEAIDFYPTLLDLLGVERPRQQTIDGVSYAKVLTSGGKLARTAYFNYFPHGGPAKPPGVSVRSGDWKLIRWFETGPEFPNRHKLYNLRDDLGESRNLAGSEATRVRELDALIDRFLADTRARVPKPNPSFKSTNAPKPAANAASPKAAANVDGWVPRFSKASLRDGALHVEADGRTPFLGVAGLNLEGPVTLKRRSRAAGGLTKAQWRTSEQETFPDSGQTADLTLTAGQNWSESKVELPVRGTLLHLRFHLPADARRIEIDWVELSPATGTSRRWEFEQP